MDVTEKNGQPTMDEILASIRRLIAEEPMLEGAQIDFNARPILVNGEAEDVSEFDLPAIFRSSATPQPEKAAPLFNRLSDAIRNATGHGAVIEGPNDSAAAQPPGSNDGERSLSSLKLSSGPQTGNEHSAPPSAQSAEPQPPVERAPLEGAPTAEPSVARVMAPFKDRTFLKLAAGGEPSPRAAMPETPPGPPPAPAAPVARAADLPVMLPAPKAEAGPATPQTPARPTLDFGAIIPSRFEREADAPVAPAPAGPPPRAEAAAPTVEPPPARPAPASVDTSPEPSPEAEPMPTASLEDTTADLLRPMLRQWLADNMPRMVEKALYIEVAQSLKGPKPQGK